MMAVMHGLQSHHSGPDVESKGMRAIFQGKGKKKRLENVKKGQKKRKRFKHLRKNVQNLNIF